MKAYLRFYDKGDNLSLKEERDIDSIKDIEYMLDRKYGDYMIDDQSPEYIAVDFMAD